MTRTDADEIKKSLEHTTTTVAVMDTEGIDTTPVTTDTTEEDETEKVTKDNDQCDEDYISLPSSKEDTKAKRKQEKKSEKKKKKEKKKAKKKEKKKKEENNRSRRADTIDTALSDTISETTENAGIIYDNSNPNVATQLRPEIGNKTKEQEYHNVHTDAGESTRDERPYGGDGAEDDRECWDDGSDECKIFLTRIPAKFDTDSITRIFEDSFGEGCIQHISLPPTRTDVDGENDDNGGNGDRDKLDAKCTNTSGSGEKENKCDEEGDRDHRGFAFVTMISIFKRDEALKKGTIRGAFKETSKRKYTMYIRPVIRDGAETTNVGDGSDSLDMCYLWSKRRCPYGDKCKFKHVGEGACIVIDAGKDGDRMSKMKKQKCFAFQSKRGCNMGDRCPYSHDIKEDKAPHFAKEKKDKDCINWRTKGKCRNRDTCPYRHDEAVLEAFLSKKRRRMENKHTTTSPKNGEKNPQPLSVRVFGLNYDTKVSDIHEYFGHCGLIREVMFPVYEDSGRSKGYCGILFTSPKATAKACELDGKELLGRWLSVQPGKMYLKQWEERERIRCKNCENDDENTPPTQCVGEFGQKVKKRKKHGFKD